jgi:hypothetical protein
VPHLIVGVQVEPDRARVGLVYQDRHVGFQHDRPAKLCGSADGTIGIGDVAAVGQRDAVAAEQLGGLAGLQPAAGGSARRNAWASARARWCSDPPAAG